MFTRSLLDVGLNAVLAEHEERYSYTAKNFNHDDRFIAGVIGDSIRDGKAKQFTETDYGRDYILSGFECYAQDRKREIGLVALSGESDRSVFPYIAASKGTASEVRLPVGPFNAELQRRCRAGIKSKLLLVHNHPRHPFKSFLEESLGMPLGPSGTDRRTMTAWKQFAHLVEAEFFLYESGEWRRITVPHFEWLAEKFHAILCMLEGKQPPPPDDMRSVL